jgi:hypothetical protein
MHIPAVETAGSGLKLGMQGVYGFKTPSPGFNRVNREPGKTNRFDGL